LLAWLSSTALLAQEQAPAASGLPADSLNELLRPDRLLRRPLESAPAPVEQPAPPETLLTTPIDPPLGFSGAVPLDRKLLLLPYA
jgi:hypothetical protein